MKRTHEEIAVAAYYLWLAEGCPWGNADLTFVNWMVAQGSLETHDLIAVAAYYLWLAKDCPWGDSEITFANWLDAQSNVENAPSPEPSPWAGKY